MAALLHGQVAEAVRWNGMVVVAMAVCAGWAAAAYGRAILGRERVWPEIPRRLMQAGLASAVIFAVVRNVTLGN